MEGTLNMNLWNIHRISKIGIPLTSFYSLMQINILLENSLGQKNRQQWYLEIFCSLFRYALYGLLFLHSFIYMQNFFFEIIWVLFTSILPISYSLKHLICNATCHEYINKLYKRTPCQAFFFSSTISQQLNQPRH